MTIKNIKEKGLLIFEGVVGSHAYGLSTPESDIDKKGVYIQPIKDIISFGYIEQVSDKKNDQVYYEIRRFLELISTNNPNILELLNLPEECIIYKHPIYDLILKNTDKFISKMCKNSFAGYAIQQIKKARGLNKKIINPIDKKKKTPLDFCYVIKGNGTISLINWLTNNALKQKFCGVVNIPNAKDMYALYYDFKAHNRFSFEPYENSSGKNLKIHKYLYLENGVIKSRNFNPGEWEAYKNEYLKGEMFLNYKGIVKLEDSNFTSNQLRLSSIPKNESELCTFSFNQDGYTKYCKDYKEYWNWVDKRNQVRYNNVKYGKGYDSKNMMHCHRLLDMSIEIAEGKGINVRRTNRDYLMEIRSGKMEYNKLVSDAKLKIKKIDRLFEKSNLKKEVDKKFINDLLIKIRMSYESFK